MYLDKITIDNYMSIGHVEVELADRGLIAIEGINLDDPFCDNNMSGKSAFFEAIGEALFGQNYRGIHGKDIIRKGEKECRIEIIVDGQKVIREWSKKSSTKNMIYVEGTETTEEKLLSGIHYDWNRFINFDYFGDDTCDQPGLFGSGANSQKFQVVSHFLRFGTWDAAQEKAKIRHKEIENQILALRQQHSNLERSIQIAESVLPELQNQVVIHNERIKQINATSKNEISSLNEQQDNIQHKIDTLEKGKIPVLIENVTELQINHSELVSELNGYKDSKENLVADITKLTTKLSLLRSGIREKQEIIDSGRCDKCEQLISKDHHWKDQLVEKKKEVEHTFNNLQMLQTQRTKFEEVIRDALLKVDESYKLLQNKQYELQTETSKLENLQGSLHTINESIANHKAKTQTELDTNTRAMREVDERWVLKKKELKQLIIDKETMENDILKAVENFKISEFTSKKTFSTQGTKSSELVNFLPRINDELRNILPHILEDDYPLEISGRRELSSKAMKNELSLKIGGPYKAQSRSQRRRVDLAIQIALSNLNQHGCNCKFFDELLSSLDATGIDMVIEFLESLLSKELDSIFVISHHKDVAIQNRLTFQKKNGVTSLVA